MARWGRIGWLAVILALLLEAGCSGVIAEMTKEDGSKERLRIQGGEKWKDYDRNPLKEDGTCFILKKESTF